MATVESAFYNGNGSIIAVIDGRTVGIPDDMSNMDRVLVAEWEAAGGVIAPYAEQPEPIPDRVSPAQAEIALYNVDNGTLLTTVNAMIDTSRCASGGGRLPTSHGTMHICRRSQLRLA
ncbi:hypothetical protein [Mesorhizobium sp. NZP2298]|uniref:hypothetical protein n=1 Tax=Mesorhizobium sp. NZP2298 TaxID=2483403 RepID=UPI001557E19E|nr:hypothetical protein [Mesorhizobium sp. NZP2298]QKC99167.1 hypothetical protein EB231_34830 [Mesorhizobium sp. NZP2298]